MGHYSQSQKPSGQLLVIINNIIAFTMADYELRAEHLADDMFHAGPAGTQKRKHDSP